MALAGFFNAELKLRAVSAIILASLVVFITYQGGYAFDFMWMVIGFLAFHEFMRMVGASVFNLLYIVSILMLIVVFAAWFSGDRHSAYLMSAVCISTLATCEAVFKRSLWSPLAFAYAILPFIALSEMRNSEPIGFLLIIFLFACVWGADIFAYVFGRLIGGPKLVPKISPNKTWAGFIGSLIGAVFLCYMVVVYSGLSPASLFWISVIIVAVVSQIGDLVISAIKRKFNIKDTGKIIPGHGGVLDRIDGLIPASIIFWLILKSQGNVRIINDELGTALFFF